MIKNLYFICGPTATGKSSFALKLAKKIGGVIINADSMQVYKNLEILTARPTKDDLKKIPHYLYGYIDGAERYNVAKWCKDILIIINKNKTKKIPSIIVGGSGMYIQTLLEGLIELPEISESYKKKSEKILNDIGLNKFIELINKFDSNSLKEINVNDTMRLKRIWEIYYSTGITFSEWKKKQNKKFLKNFSYEIYLFIPPRNAIYEKVDNRFVKMIDNGAIEEVKKLLLLNLDKSLPIMKAHGVPEISDYLNNKSSIQNCISKGQQVTRNYVKRQLTWWRSSNLKIDKIFDDFSD